MERSNPINIQLCVMFGVAMLLVVDPFNISEAISVSATQIQTELQSIEYEPVTTPNKAINLNCSFIRAGPTYLCRLNDLNLKTDVTIASVSGTHLPGKTNSDVKGIHFKSGSMYYIPSGLGNFFPNLVTLVAGVSYGSPISIRNIKRSSFSKLNKLTLLSIFSDSITVVDDDALWDLPILQDFLLSGNGSITLSENAFRKNLYLREVVFLSTQLNGGIPKNLFQSNLLLEAVYFQECSIETIDENLFARNQALHLDNACIDAYYETDAHKFDNSFTNLTEFQGVIRANCSCH